jgi:hypothetical protein
MKEREGERERRMTKETMRRSVSFLRELRELRELRMRELRERGREI